MAYTKTAAYDLSLFDTSAEKIKVKKKVKAKPEVVKLPEKELHKIRFRKHNLLKLIGGITAVLTITALVITIIMGQVQLTELNQEIITAQNTLADQQSVYRQTQMDVQSKLSTAEIQQYAESQLGMTKASNTQMEFIQLSAGDKAEIAEVSDGGFFGWISGLWS